MMNNKEMTLKLSVANDFSKMPSERSPETSGASFRSIIKNILVHNSNNQLPLHVDMNGTLGYASSWLSNAFGGLDHKYPNRIIPLSNDSSLILEINQYLKNSLFLKKKLLTACRLDAGGCQKNSDSGA